MGKVSHVDLFAAGFRARKAARRFRALKAERSWRSRSGIDRPESAASQSTTEQFGEKESYAVYLSGHLENLLPLNRGRQL
jgi:hypothetical protein